MNYKVGDSIKILVEENSNIQYKSSTQSMKTYSVDIQEGEMSAVFNFIPEGKTEESKNIQDKDEVEIKTSINATITDVKDKLITINASKRLTLNNKTSIIQINGDVNYFDIKNNMVYSHDLINQTVRISTLLENVNQIISAADLEKVITNPDATTDIKEETRLKENKKQELLIEYFNKILSLIF